MAERGIKYKPNEIEQALIQHMVQTKSYYRIINLGNENTLREEQEMELLRAYLQDGYPLPEAEKKACEELKNFYKFIEEIEKESQTKKGEG